MSISPAASTWLRNYQPVWIGADTIAGVTLVAYLLPAAIGDASLANLPPETGLYACLFAGLVFWIFCGSRFTSVTVTSSISLVLGISLADVAGGDASRFIGLAIGTTFLVAAIAFTAWLAKAGVLVHFISETVMTGFEAESRSSSPAHNCRSCSGFVTHTEASARGMQTSLFKFSTLKQLWQHDRSEFVVVLAAFVGVLSFGLLRGVLIGAAISLVQLFQVSAHPHVALLGRIPGTRRYSDCERHHDNESIPDVMIFRPEVALVYFNIDRVCDTILERVHTVSPPPRLVVLDLSAAPRVDMQSAHTLAAMATELTAAGIRFQAVEPRSSVRDRLRIEEVDTKLGGVNRFTAVADVVEHFQREQAVSPNLTTATPQPTNTIP